eukprot:6028895-Pleurochrysis_carterae.AAC.1
MLAHVGVEHGRAVVAGLDVRVSRHVRHAPTRELRLAGLSRVRLELRLGLQQLRQLGISQ